MKPVDDIHVGQHSPSNSPRRNTGDAQDACHEALEATDWNRVSTDLDDDGYSTLRGLVTDRERSLLAAMYTDDARFRSRVVMAHHGFGRGEYRYFAYPLPHHVAQLRAALYARLAPVANRWHASMGNDVRFPPSHDAYIARCHTAGQVRPTPLLLQYGEGDFNCLHQDLYGDHVFPLQVIVLLSSPAADFTGGELVLTEQRPRQQSRVAVVPLAAGDAAIIAVHQRPVAGKRGSYRVAMRHGVSRVRSGHRHTLGIIFHDAT